MKKFIFLGLAVLFVATGCSFKMPQKTVKLTPDEIKVKAANFINENLVQKGSEVSIKEVTEEGDLFKVIVNAPGSQQEIISYMTKDGKTFFPQAMDLEKIEKDTKEKQSQDDAAKAKEMTEMVKSAKPVVELFVMSHCPYGTQIEKGIIPVVEALGAKIDFSLKFCDYAMHGKKELDEQLRQTCIAKEQNNKYLGYLKCFLADDTKSAACIAKNKIDQSKLDACVKATDAKYKVTANFNDKSTWTGNYPTFDVFKADNVKYDVKGSPSLVINGKTLSTGRDSATLLSSICSAFDNKPAECDKQLSSESPAPGFGFAAATGGAADASCGN